MSTQIHNRRFVCGTQPAGKAIPPVNHEVVSIIHQIEAGQRTSTRDNLSRLFPLMD